MEHQTANIVVPVNLDNAFGIKQNSAILVTQKPNQDGFHTMYYEGNLHGAVNLETFEEKLMVAAGRMRDNYPTIARECPSVELVDKMFIKVGEYDMSNWTPSISEPTLLNAWLS